METNIIKIGNSQGLIIPRGIINKLNFNKTVDLQVKEGKLQVSPIKEKKATRKNWEKMFAGAIKAGHKPEKTVYIENDFDKNDWTW